MFRQSNDEYFSAIFCFDKKDTVEPLLIEWEYDNKSKWETAKPMVGFCAAIILTLFNSPIPSPSMN